MKDKAAHRLAATLIEKGLLREYVRSAASLCGSEVRRGIPLHCPHYTWTPHHQSRGWQCDEWRQRHKRCLDCPHIEGGRPRRGSKLGEVIALLSRNKGAPAAAVERTSPEVAFGPRAEIAGPIESILIALLCDRLSCSVKRDLLGLCPATSYTAVDHELGAGHVA